MSGKRIGFGPGFLQDAQGLAVLRSTGDISRAEVRENLRQRYGLVLPEPEFVPDFPPALEPAQVLAGAPSPDDEATHREAFAEWRKAYQQATGEDIDFDPDDDDDFEEEDLGAGS